MSLGTSLKSLYILLIVWVVVIGFLGIKTALKSLVWVRTSILWITYKSNSYDIVDFTNSVLDQKNSIFCSSFYLQTRRTLYIFRKHLWICVWLVCKQTKNRYLTQFKIGHKESHSECTQYKVQIFWEGHKILWNLHRRFVLCNASQIYGRDFEKFCSLLRIYEL